MSREPPVLFLRVCVVLQFGHFGRIVTKFPFVRARVVLHPYFSFPQFAELFPFACACVVTDLWKNFQKSKRFPFVRVYGDPIRPFWPNWFPFVRARGVSSPAHSSGHFGHLNFVRARGVSRCALRTPARIRFPSCVIQAQTQSASGALRAHNALVGQHPKPFERLTAAALSACLLANESDFPQRKQVNTVPIK